MYNMSEADYERLLSEQGSVCAVCKNPPKDGSRLTVDHDHDSGAVRGLLCYKCNTGIGQLGDGRLLAAAIEYIGNQINRQGVA